MAPGASKATCRLPSTRGCRLIDTAAPALLPLMRPVARSAVVICTPTSAAAPSAASQDRSKLAGTGANVAQPAG